MAGYVKLKSAWTARLLIPLALSGLGLQIGFASMLLVSEAWMTRGIAAQEHQFPDVALDAYERAYSWNRHDQRLLHLLGVLRWRSGDKEGATGALAEALELAPHEVNTLVPYAEQLAFSARLPQAERAIQYALALAPGNWRSEQVAGLVRGFQGDHAGAAVHFERAVKLTMNPGPELLNSLSNALLEQGDAGRALHFANRALRDRPQYADHHLIRGKALLALGRPEEAAKALGLAERFYRDDRGEIRSAPEKLTMTRRHLIRAHIAQRRPNRAIETLAELAASRGPVPEVTRLAEELGLRLNTPGGHRDAAAQFNLGRVMAIVGDYEAADQALARASSGLPRDDRIACALLRAQVLIELSRPEEALTVLRALAEADREGAEYRIAFGDALAASGDLAAAHLEYENVLRDSSLAEDLRRSVEAKRDALPNQ
ncbi:MAG: tetratricopeptide repeat protein [Candidatus Hydrogenedentes bacterium]|nr:tetratricopeptide repeat protein [Candidatus Hydrogenedentota bacterium]